MATHSSILAWKIPWTEDLVGYGPRGHRELDTTERVNKRDQACFLSQTFSFRCWQEGMERGG